MGDHMAARTLIRQGQLYWVDAEPHAGKEEGGHNRQNGNIRRPVVVVSNDSYNRVGLSIVFPVTSKRQINRYLMPVMAKHASSIILTQILGYDMFARNAKSMGISVSESELAYLKDVVHQML